MKSTLKNQGGQWNFSSWFMKNVSIIWTKKDYKEWNKQHFVEYKTEIMQHILKIL